MKKLNNMLEAYGFKGPKHDQGTRKPGMTEPFKKFIGNTPVSAKGNAVAATVAGQEFIDDHEIEKTPDANGNGDDVFKGSKVKTIDRKKEKHGYDAKSAEDVNEMSKAQTKKREDIVKGMKKNLSSFTQRYGKDAESVMYATATKRAMGEEVEVAEALDYNAKAKENIDFHHGQATDYAKEIASMLGQYKKHVKGEKHTGDWHAMDMAQVHGGLRQVHDMLSGAVNSVKPMSVPKLAESVEIVQEETKYDNILEAVEAHKQIQEEQELVSAYASILESIYESLETQEEKDNFNTMLESEDAFDELVTLVESFVAEGDE